MPNHKNNDNNAMPLFADNDEPPAAIKDIVGAADSYIQRTNEDTQRLFAKKRNNSFLNMG